MPRPRRARGAIRDWIDQPMKRVALRANLLRPYRHLRFHSFGKRSIVHRPEWVYGPRQIAIGEGVVVLSHAWLSVEESAWERPAPVIRIGDDVWIRPFCTISASESVVVEDHVVISAFTTVVDSDHTSRGESENVLWNPVKTAPVRIGSGTWIGERVAVLRGSNIGRSCVIGANSVVRGEIPDFSVAVGAPARVIGSTRDGEAHDQLLGGGASPRKTRDAIEMDPGRGGQVASRKRRVPRT
jgi:acetyltransferase-like isoleucine patch superfamily enzyme